ncbi:MAG: hypothetical protein OXU98_10180 [Gammaproteobacteria bacterium]|nr:hypothetical protein [Gammaproteobacteria bacterium]
MNAGNSYSALESRFIRAVRESYTAYNEHGARSNQKLRPLHQWVADEIQRLLGDGYSLQSLRKDDEGGEETVAGKYYDKTVDVSIAKDDAAPMAIISIKFITSNFKQNANNYFEHLMGETANLRRGGIIFGHLMVLPTVVPYLKRGGAIAHEEHISNQHLQKYVKLGQDDDYPHRPDAMGIGLISLPLDDLSDANKIKLADLTKMEISESVCAVLENEFSVPRFMRDMQRLIEAKR